MAGVTSLYSAAVSSVFSQLYVSFDFLQLSSKAVWKKNTAIFYFFIFFEKQTGKEN